MKNCIRFVLIFAISLGIFTSCEALKPIESPVYKMGVDKITTDAPASVNNGMLISQLRFDIIDYAKQFVGVRYRHGCRNPEVGFDCSGFTSYVLKNFNVKLSPSSSDQANEGKIISMNDARPGDLIFFGRGGNISHVGMVVENYGEGMYIIHASSSRGVVVENITEIGRAHV